MAFRLELELRLGWGRGLDNVLCLRNTRICMCVGVCVLNNWGNIWTWEKEALNNKCAEACYVADEPLK